MAEILTDMLARTMRANGLSYGALAKRAHASTGSLHRIMHGTDHPRRNTLLRICAAMKMDVDEINTALRLARHADLEPDKGD